MEELEFLNDQTHRVMRLLALFLFLCPFLNAQELQLELLDAHEDLITALVMPASSGLIVTASKDEMAYAWNLNSGEKVWSFKGHNNAIEAMTTEGDLLITAGREEDILVWNIRRRKTSQTTDGARILRRKTSTLTQQTASWPADPAITLSSSGMYIAAKRSLT